MKKFNLILLAMITFLGSPTAALSQDKYAEGLGAAAKNYGLGELVKAAKKSAPDSYLPTIIEHLLLGVSLTSDPVSSATTILEGVYPGSLAAGAISQLLDKHGADIARRTYRDSNFGDLYSDPSIIPNQGTTKAPDPVWAICAEMFEVDDGGVATCSDLAKKIQRCDGVKITNTSEVEYCDIYLSEFYENMELMGKSDLVKQAGKVARTEFKKSLKQQCSDGLGQSRNSVLYDGKYKWIGKWDREQCTSIWDVTWNCEKCGRKNVKQKVTMKRKLNTVEISTPNCTYSGRYENGNITGKHKCGVSGGSFKNSGS
jgi:hypothetical protein